MQWRTERRRETARNASEQQSPSPWRRKIDEKEGLVGRKGWRVAVVASLNRVSEAALRDLQPTGETRANKSPQLPPVRAICLDGRLMPDIIHPGNNTLLSNEV